MGFLRDLIVRIKGDKTHLDSTVKGVKGSFEGLKTTVMGVAAAGAAAFAVILNWVKDTDFGMQSLNKTMGVAKQLVSDLIMNQGFNLKQAASIADRQSKIRSDDIREGYQIKKLQSELNQLIISAADNTKSHSEKLQALTDAMAKQKELKEFLLADAREELQVAYEHWSINKESLSAQKAYFEIAGRIKDIEGMDRLRIQSQFTTELVAQKKRADDLVDAFTPIPPTLEEIKKLAGEITKIMTDDLGKSSSSVFAEKTPFKFFNNTQKLAPGPTQYAGTSMLAGMMGEDWQAQLDESEMMAAIEEFNDRLQDALSQMYDMAVDYGTQIAEGLGEALGGANVEELGKGLLMSLANLLSSFGKMLITLGIGTEAFKESMITGNGVGAIIAGTAMIVAAGAIRGMMSSAGKSGVTGGGYSSASASTQTIKVVGELRGKDIYFSQKRYTDDNG